jgi:hypothetical protein
MFSITSYLTRDPLRVIYFFSEKNGYACFFLHKTILGINKKTTYANI